MIEKYVKNHKLRSLIEWIIALIIAAISYLFISNFIYVTAKVSGPSMNPTLYHGDRIIINKLAYRIGSPQRGHIIAFPYPVNPSDKLVKRIIGMPGDHIEIYENKFYVNGDILNDEFSVEDLVSTGDVFFPLDVGDNEYFVLGDNRNNSRDSRTSAVGLVQRKNIIGKVYLRFMPLESIGLIK